MTSGSTSAVWTIFRCPAVPRMPCGGKVVFQSIGIRWARANAVSASSAGMISSLPGTYGFPTDRNENVERVDIPEHQTRHASVQ
jgi:hypothetical protein